MNTSKGLVRVDFFDSDCTAGQFCNPIGWNCSNIVNVTNSCKLSCVHGKCDNTNGIAKCTCEPGYSGELCQNFDSNNGNSNFTNPCTLSCVHGKCENATGIAECICNLGYSGKLCDNENNTPSNPCTLDCNPRGACVNTTGSAICICDESANYAFQNNKCVRSQPVCNNGCGNGVCKYSDDESSVTFCDCDLGYKSQSGPCSSCNDILGYVESNGKCVCDESAGLVTSSNGTCVQTNAPKCQYDCGSNGVCEFITATTSDCVCKNGFETKVASLPCSSCPIGSVLKGSTCVCDVASGYISSGSDCICDTLSGFNNTGSACACSESLGFIKEGSNCVCKLGFENIEGTCVAKVPVCVNGCGKGVCEFINVATSDATQCKCFTEYVTTNAQSPCSECASSYSKNSNGICLRVCESGYSGEDCSVYTPPTQCIEVPSGSLTYCKSSVYYKVLNTAFSPTAHYSSPQSALTEITNLLKSIDSEAEKKAQSMIDTIINGGKTCDDTCRKAIANYICYQDIKPCFSDKSTPYEKSLCKNTCAFIWTNGIVNSTSTSNCEGKPESECFYGKYLPPSTSCYGKLYTDAAVCSGKGLCMDENSCSCRTGFSGLNCQFNLCFGIDGNSSSVCNGNGDCVGVNNCKCKTGFTGSSCNIPICNGKQESEGGCSFQGTCTSSGCYCKNNFAGSSCSSCKEGFTGSKCDVPICNGIKASDKGVCGGRGSCVSIEGVPTCKCSEGYDGDLCQNFKCNGIDRSNRDVCSGVGSCVSVDTCVCKGNYEPSKFCSVCTLAYSGVNCTGRICSDEGTCNGHGVCTSDFKCSCTGNWVGEYCRNCKEGFVGSNCQVQCTSAQNCSSRGTCNSDGSCTCIGNSMGANCEKCVEGWYGEKCDFKIDQNSFGFSQNGDSISGVVYSSLKKKFTCSELITDVSSIGEGAGCLINSETMTMTISIGPSASIKVNDKLIFKKYFSSPETVAVTVETKDFVPIPPTATLTADKSIISKACGSIYLDASGSISKDRRALKFIWAVEISPSADDVSTLQKILDQQQDISGVKISAKDLSVGSYSVKVTVSSTFSQRSTVAFASFEVTDLTAPTVTIKEGLQSTLVIGKTSTITPLVTFPSCYIGSGEISYVYSWDSKTTITVPILQMKEMLVFSDTYTKITEPGEYYLTLTVSQTGAASVSIPFTVSAKALPLVVGFNIRDMSQSFETDVSFVVNKNDPSNPSDASGNVQLLCSNIDTGVDCSGFKSNENNIDQTFLSFKSSMLPGVYLFTTIFTKGSRRSSATVKVTVLDQPKSSVIRVSIIAPVGSDSTSMDPSSDLILQSSSADTLSTSRVFTWSSTDLELSSISTSNKYINIPKSLLVPGATYSINVKVVDGLRSGDATFTFTVNSPPTIGILEVYPKSGIALQDEFQIKCGNGWYDTQLPLSYKFMYKTSDATIWKVLSERSEKRSIATSLPAGNLQIKVVVYDSLGAASETISEVTTSLPSSGQALGLLETAQKGSISVSSLSAVLSVVSSVTPASAEEKLALQQAGKAFIDKFFEQEDQQSQIVSESSESASTKVSIISSVSDNVRNFPDDTVSKIIDQFFTTVMGVSSSETISMKPDDIENSKKSASSLEEYVSSSVSKRAISTFTIQDLNKIDQIKANLDVFSSMKILESLESVKLVNKIYTLKNSTLKSISKVVDFGIVVNNNIMSFLNENVTIASIKIEKISQTRSVLTNEIACYTLKNEDYVITPTCTLVSNDSTFVTIQIRDSGSYVVAEAETTKPQPPTSTSGDTVIPPPIVVPKPNMNYLALLLLIIPLVAVIAVIVGAVFVFTKKRKETPGNSNKLNEKELLSI
ncbi:basal body protein [Naegleria gruberi]|uniref:Basal body protein n=1 Tax=Naegleria gruberi TaxID=5762 RepID=D2UXB6_NAEGR|nr:basal body protein [Naegleria gruberi]EFC50603.1 basal body protein [Naegleria gruberi]|eukprot:XP_002683347.1 basal body protein [Naegleria gruberi strain NEG-M]